MSTGTTVLLDTSVMIARENGRSIRTQVAIQSTVTSVITLAELQAGVLAAADIATRARRLATLDSLADMTVLAVDEIAAREWARLRAHLAEAGRRMNVNDLWIASIAAAHGLPIVTQDTDFDALDGAPGVSVIRV